MVDHATTATDWNIKPMKKFSTAVLLLTFGGVATCLPSMAASQCEFHAHAPDTHLIQTGDTLWDLAGTFLKDHGCWPRVWEHNRQQIRNPHRIYPGQTIYFDKLRGSLRLDSPPATSSQPADLRLSPTTPQRAISHRANCGHRPTSAALPVASPTVERHSTRICPARGCLRKRAHHGQPF